jgi:hypothetical protein
MTAYRVLKPIYTRTNEVFIGPNGEPDGHIHRVTGWTELGVAQDMDDANRKFPRGRKNGYSHVLEEIVMH